MRFIFFCLWALAGHAAASPTTQCLPGLKSRPSVKAHPYSHGKPHPPSPPRTQYCYVYAHGNGTDDSAAIYSAFKACNHGGVVALMDAQYTIAKPLDLTFLDSVDFVIQGQINFTPDIEFWTGVGNTFDYAYQGARLFWQIGGKDVNIYGGGVINGNGQVWWDRMVTNTTLGRPILLGIMGLKGGSMSNIKLINPPNWFHLVANSSDLIFDNLNLTALSTSANLAKNSDGWDLYRSDSIVIQNSVVSNDDDCVSFKPNSTNMVVQNMRCTNSHGISVGSLGQYVGEVDIAENLYIYNATMTTSGDAARIKIWSGNIPSNNSTSSGGGTGYVRNITYNGIHDVSDDYAIELTQCYSQKNLTLCNQYPVSHPKHNVHVLYRGPGADPLKSSMIIEDILFENFDGVASKKYDPIVGTLVCSSPDVCKNIVAKNINITTPSGKAAQWTCTNLNKTSLAINCI